MGNQALVDVFLAGGCRSYIGPVGGPLRYASALFPILLFYELTELRSLPEAIERIRRWDAEMEM